MRNKMEKMLTLRLKPSGGASYQESLGSKRSECNVPGLFGLSGVECGTGKSSPLMDASSLASLGRGNIIIPAFETEYYEPNTEKL